MTLLATANARTALVAGGFLAQGLLVARQETAAARSLLVLFGALALATLIWRRGTWSLLACSAALGGLGMAVGGLLDGGAHCAPAVLLSWAGGLMIVGCAAACALEPAAPLAAATVVAHHATGIAGMMVGMRLPLLLEPLGHQLWGLHLAMVFGMTLGGWLALAAARALRRALGATAHPSTG